jgi:hemerythrin-like metal-binding protein
MNLYDWKDSYSVEINSIDDDHKGMFRIINHLFDAMSHGKARELLDEILYQLIDYTKTHFRREEMYFATTSYPETLEHKLQHEMFIDKIVSIKKGFENGDKEISIELIKYLSDWLVNHILVSDKRYMLHLKKFGLS